MAIGYLICMVLRLMSKHVVKRRKHATIRKNLLHKNCAYIWYYRDKVSTWHYNTVHNRKKVFLISNFYIILQNITNKSFCQ